MKFNIIFYGIGTVLKYLGILFLLPIICAVCFKENHAILPYVAASLISSALGFLMTVKKVEEKEINSTNKKEALTLVFFIWLLFGVLCTIPYFFYGFSVPNALFEAVSGITTTGATIISDFSQYPKSLFFYRSLTQWLGGMGIIVLFIAILPQFAVAGRNMFYGEMTGPVEDKITPRIRYSASWLWGLYILFTFVEVLLLKFVCGINFYDSICTAFSTLSSGGFSPQAQSIAAYGDWKVTLIVLVFMFIAGVNFLLQYKIFIKKKPEAFLKSEEFKVYIGLIFTLSLIVFAILMLKTNMQTPSAILHSFFQTVSIITTTGFASCDYGSWNIDAKIILFLLMFTGACAGSTSGGFKIIRWIFVFKYLKNEISKIIHPQAVYPIKIEGTSVAEDTKGQLVAFVIFYFAIFGISTFLVALIEHNTTVALTGSIAMLGNVGPAFGPLNPFGNYSELAVATKFIFIFNMLIGRLELIPFLALLHPDLWHKRG